MWRLSGNTSVSDSDERISDEAGMTIPCDKYRD